MLGFFIVFLVFNVSFAEEPDSQEYRPNSYLMVQADDKLLKLIKEHKAEIARQTASPPHKGQPQKPIAPTNPFKYDTQNSNNKKIDPKVEKMTKCFADIQEVLNSRFLKKARMAEVSVAGCDNHYREYYTAGIWFENYPNRPDCYLKGETRYLKPFFRADNSPPEEEKDQKLEQCLAHLAKLNRGENPDPPAVAKPPLKPIPPEPYDPKVEKMAKCFSDTYEAIKVDKKESLIAKGSKLMNILCEDMTHYSSYGRNIWCLSAPATAFCYDITSKLSAGSDVGHRSCMFSEGYKVPEARKDRQLADCNGRLERRSALKQCFNSIKQMGFATEPLYAYSMLSRSNGDQIRELKKCKGRLSQLRSQFRSEDRGGNR